MKYQLWYELFGFSLSVSHQKSLRTVDVQLPDVLLNIHRQLFEVKLLFAQCTEQMFMQCQMFVPARLKALKKKDNGML